ncbi:MAG: transcription-repair coupling factor [Desulfobacteraceae bacterium]|nr:transcription-repair coupling factor [Desulfobacteraceae bacterium]
MKSFSNEHTVPPKPSGLDALLEMLPRRDSGVEILGLAGSERSLFLSRLFRESRRSVLLVASTAAEAESLAGDLTFFQEPEERAPLHFPAYNILPFKPVSYHNETAAQRIATLYRLMTEEQPMAAVATVDSLLHRTIPREALGGFAELLQSGEDVDRRQLVEKLTTGGYVHSSLVEEPGDFSVRGGIIDIFCPLYPEPLRLELFGDTVDLIRFFDPSDQRSLRRLEEAVLIPARETVIVPERLDAIVTRIRALASDESVRVTRVREIVRKVREEPGFPGVESLLPAVFPETDTLLDYLPAQTIVVLTEPGELERKARDLWKRIERNVAMAREQDRFRLAPELMHLRWRELEEKLRRWDPIAMKSLGVEKQSGYHKPVLQVQFPVESNAELREELKRVRGSDQLLAPLVDWIEEREGTGCRTVLVCRNKAQMQRLDALLKPYGLHLRWESRLSDLPRAGGKPAGCLGSLSAGFTWTGEGIALITADEVFGSTGRKIRPARPSSQVAALSLTDLQSGDIVVHEEHGIGRYMGLVKLTVEGTTNDFLLIVYQGEDRLYLPVERMGLIQKYMGIEGRTPVLDKMGGTAWERVKAKVKRSAEKIAGALLEIYAARKVEKGHSFSPSDETFQEFEAGFSYEETPDQASAIEDVLRDMESVQPMDRLVCGDVGYGKTEVALRAAFKAVNDNHQVAVVVPTTVLAEQHFKTFSDRFEHYPVRIACLTRFRSPAEQKGIVGELKKGTVDIVVGTHRLLQKDIAFASLGLLVLDEEQRFGVQHKEAIKRLRKTVDVLTLTATPIPRTLHLSLTGIRDISIISTPPEDRRSIITYVAEFDEDLIREAVLRELQRGGQIFFIHNDIRGIGKMADRLERIAPEARIDVAHGRMKEEELENVMIRFVQQEIDLLVCTTIVESGLDIPAANTILIHRADRFGLAQMYQLRGRVGRADAQAYAYLFIPAESQMTRDARKRLKVLMEHSDLGSGFQIAMSDLRIRGGGTILGASQSGHIAAVGYEMFLKLMENAVAELKGETVLMPLEPEINVSLSAFLPESYLPDIDQRLMAYRKLSRLRSLEEIREAKAELEDRFGLLPEEAANLLLKIMLKVLAAEAGIRRLDLTGSNLVLHFSEKHVQRPEGILEMMQSLNGSCEMSADQSLRIRLGSRNRNGRLTQVKNLLKELARRVTY